MQMYKVAQCFQGSYAYPSILLNRSPLLDCLVFCCSPGFLNIKNKHIKIKKPHSKSAIPFTQRFAMLLTKRFVIISIISFFQLLIVFIFSSYFNYILSSFITPKWRFNISLQTQYRGHISRPPLVSSHHLSSNTLTPREFLCYSMHINQQSSPY